MSIACPELDLVTNGIRWKKYYFMRTNKDTHTHINKNFFIILNRVSILPTLFGIFGMLR